MIDDEGGVETYKAGDSFMMPRGCKCTWDVKEPVRKLYVVLDCGGLSALSAALCSDVMRSHVSAQ